MKMRVQLIENSSLHKGPTVKNKLSSIAVDYDSGNLMQRAIFD